MCAALTLLLPIRVKLSLLIAFSRHHISVPIHNSNTRHTSLRSASLNTLFVRSARCAYNLAPHLTQSTGCLMQMLPSSRSIFVRYRWHTLITCFRHDIVLRQDLHKRHLQNHHATLLFTVSIIYCLGDALKPIFESIANLS